MKHRQKQRRLSTMKVKKKLKNKNVWAYSIFISEAQLKSRSLNVESKSLAVKELDCIVRLVGDNGAAVACGETNLG